MMVMVVVIVRGVRDGITGGHIRSQLTHPRGSSPPPGGGEKKGVGLLV